MVTPAFFVVGAQKAGTTALHDWLVQQPDVCLPTIKETHYFSHDERFHQGLDWYRSQFPKSHQVACLFGEVDPEYMFFEHSPNRIRDFNARPKFVFLLRQPLERAYSQYLMSVRRGQEDLPFNEALLAEESRMIALPNDHALNHQSYLSRGKYSGQIARFRESFPDAEFKFVKFDDLVSTAEGMGVYTEICQFIGVRSSPTLAKRDKKSNQASAPRSRLLRDFLWHGGVFRKYLGKLIPSKDVKRRIGVWLDSLNQKPISNSGQALDFDIPEFIIDAIRTEIHELERITGLNCQDWLQRLETVTRDGRTG